MNEPDDIIELHGHRVKDAARGASSQRPGSSRKFLSIWFRCCHAYGRLYRNDQGTEYAGQCPKCGSKVHASIGPGGTTRRIFEAR